MKTTVSFKVSSLQSKKFFIDYIQKYYPELTIIGLEKNDDNTFNGAGIQYAPIGSIIELNHDNKYDVDWYQNEVWAMLNGVNTSLDLTNDWHEIKKDIHDYAKHYAVYHAYNNFFNNIPEKPEKNQIILKNGTKITIFDAFIEVGNEIVSRYVDESYRFPKSVLSKLGGQISELKTLIIQQ